jgi:hypothetical protein
MVVYGTMVYVPHEECGVEEPRRDSKNGATGDTPVSVIEEEVSSEESSTSNIEEEISNRETSGNIQERKGSSSTVHPQRRLSIEIKGIGILLLDLQNNFAKEGGKQHERVSGSVEKTGMLQKIPTVVAAAR